MRLLNAPKKKPGGGGVAAGLVSYPPFREAGKAHFITRLYKFDDVSVKILSLWRNNPAKPDTPAHPLNLSALRDEMKLGHPQYLVNACVVHRSLGRALTHWLDHAGNDFRRPDAIARCDLGTKTCHPGPSSRQ